MRSEGLIAFVVPPVSAADAFRHPFRYAPWSGAPPADARRRRSCRRLHAGGVPSATQSATAERRLDHFLAAVERAQIPSFNAFADGVRQWRWEPLAYFDEPTTNDYAEGVINTVKVIKRQAYESGKW